MKHWESKDYQKVNESFRRRLVYHVGKEYGFFVELNYMLNAMIYCLSHRIQFQIYSADYIYVGNDVTDRMEHGDVILGQGDITLKAGYIEIKNSTTVPLGTTLMIEN